MIIIRQREFGNKENKIAKKTYEAGLGNKYFKNLIKIEKTIPEHSDGRAAAIYLGRKTQQPVQAKLKDLINLGLKPNIDQKISLKV